MAGSRGRGKAAVVLDVLVGLFATVVVVVIVVIFIVVVIIIIISKLTDTRETYLSVQRRHKEICITIFSVKREL